MEAITKYGSHSQALVLSRSCWRLNLDSSYHYRLPGSLSFSRHQCPKKLCLVRATMNPRDDNSKTRPFTPHSPNLWGYHFLSASANHTEMDDLWRQIEALKPIVNAMLLPSNGADAKQITCLIHTLVSLGVSYHFEDKIVEFLNDAFENIEDMIINCKEDDLYTVSVIFRVFRLYGHNITPDIFNKFKGDDGNFKECLKDDVRGMLSFYEASHFGTTAEDILAEALSFTQTHLELFVVGDKAAHPHITKLIQAALYIPQNSNLEVLMIREYIGFYELETDHNEMLLKLAKLNFRLFQLHYIQELKTLTAWWRELDLVSKIPNYFRERLVEAYFWATAVYYEPQYAHARVMLAKAIIVFDLLDTTFDAYGTLDELKSLVQSFERWGSDAVDVLPDYLKIVFRTLFDLFKELEGNVRPEGRSFTIQYAYDELKIVMKAYLQEAEWSKAGHVPSYEAYMDQVGMPTSLVEVLLAITFIAMGDIAGEEIYEWLRSRPKLTQALIAKARHRDDMATFKEEMKRGDIANGINCYMKQYRVTEEEACLEFDKRSDHMSKVMNEEFIKAAKFVPLHILRPVLNYGRIADVFYKYGDGYTFSGEKTKEYITSLYVDLITL